MDVDSLAECSSLIRRMNADATILQTQHSLVNIASLLHKGFYNQDAGSAASSHAAQDANAPSIRPREDRSASASTQGASHSASLDHSGDGVQGSFSASASVQQARRFQLDPEGHRHTSRVSTMAIRPSGPVPLQRCALVSAR